MLSISEAVAVEVDVQAMTGRTQIEWEYLFAQRRRKYLESGRYKRGQLFEMHRAHEISGHLALTEWDFVAVGLNENARSKEGHACASYARMCVRFPELDAEPRAARPAGQRAEPRAARPANPASQTTPARAV